jgi:hypothetical protein
MAQIILPTSYLLACEKERLLPGLNQIAIMSLAHH